MHRFLIVLAAMLPIALWPARSMPGEPVNVGTLIEQLDDADFSRREAAVASLAARGADAIDALVAAAEHGSPEVASRAVQLLERLMESSEATVIDAADSALVRLVESDQPHASALAGAALERNAAVREERAIARITELGGQLQYGRGVDPLGRPIGILVGNEEDQEPPLRLRTILISRDWTGGVEGLVELRRLAHLPDLVVYVEKGSNVPLGEVQSLASVLPGLAVHHRGAYIGIQTTTDGIAECIIGDVKADGPADKAGLVRGDTVLALNSGAVRNFQDLVDSLKEFEAGDSVTITVRRQNQVKDVKVELEAWQLPPVADDVRESGAFPPGLMVPPPRAPRLPGD